MLQLTCAELAALKDAPATPFVLQTEAGERCIEQVLRWLPGKRLVARISSAAFSEPRLLKIFFGPRQQRDYQRELNGCRGFIEGRVDTPKLLSECAGASSSLLEWTYLAGAESFEARWQRVADTERKVLYAQLLQLVARLHNAGLVQQDFHLDNLLYVDETLYLIDGGAVEVLGRPAQSSEALDNLALVLAVLYPVFDRWLAEGEAHYRGASELQLPAQLDLPALVQAKRKWRERFLQKVFRTCTAFEMERSFGRYQVVRRSLDCPELRALLRDPDGAIDTGVILKSGRSATVARVNVGSCQWVIKRYNIKSRLHAAARSLKPTRAAVSWFNGHLLEFLGIATPAPVALLENRLGPLRGRSYLVTEVCPGCHTARYFSEGAEETVQWPAVIERVEAVFYGLYRASVSHGDLKAQNILIEQDAPVLLDLDGMHSWSDRRAFIQAFRQDLARFARSWTDLEDVRAAALFSPLIGRFEQLMQHELEYGNR